MVRPEVNLRLGVLSRSHTNSHHEANLGSFNTLSRQFCGPDRGGRLDGAEVATAILTLVVAGLLFPFLVIHHLADEVQPKRELTWRSARVVLRAADPSYSTRG